MEYNNSTPLASNLKEQLDAKNMTMTQLAKNTGITYNMIKKYCAGMAEPTMSYALRMAQVLETSLDKLIGYEPPEAKDMFKEVFEQDFTYIAGFMRTVRKFPEGTALHDPLSGRTWTYGELNQDVNRLADSLGKQGVGRGSLVFYQLLNSPEFVFAYLAPQKIGAVTSPANYNFSPGETAVCLDTNKPEVYIYDSSVREMAIKALELSNHCPGVIIMAGEGQLPEGHVSYESFISGSSSGEPDVDFVPNIYNEVMRLYTSGTTGKPKGVPVNNANEVMTCHDVIMHFPMNSTDTTMNMTPWFHRGGIHSGGPAPTFYCGGRVIILREFNPQLTLSYVEKLAITFLIGVPSVIKMLERAQERYAADLSSLRGIVTMGAPFERADCIRMQKVLTENIFNGYGTTESFWNTFLRPYDLPKMSGTAGRACTDDEVRIVKLGGEPEDLIPKNNADTGEVIIRTPKSAYRYYDASEEEAGKFYKGWVYTGDIGTWDEKQYITIAGRKDDMLISGGENIYPPIVEEVLNLHPKVKMSAIAGVPDHLRGEAVVAYIVPEDEKLTVGELAKYCIESSMLSTFKRPRYYRFVKELPFTATGKLQHYIVKEMALNDMELGLLKLAIAE